MSQIGFPCSWYFITELALILESIWKMFGFNVILNVSKRLSCIRANPARISNSILNDVLVKIFWPSNLTLNMRQNKYQVNKAFYNYQDIKCSFKRRDRIFVITIFMDLEGLFSVQNFRTDWTRVWEEIWEMLRLHVHHDTVFGSVGELITQSTWKPHSFILGHKLLKVLRFSDIWEIDKLGWHGKFSFLNGC